MRQTPEENRGRHRPKRYDNKKKDENASLSNSLESEYLYSESKNKEPTINCKEMEYLLVIIKGECP